MKICYVVPGAMRSRPGGEAEAVRRVAYLAEHARGGAEVTLVDDPQGPASIESAASEHRAALRIGRLIEALDHPDAIIVGCFGDPGLPAARAAATVPVIGPAEASFRHATGVVDRFGILTVVDDVVPLLRDLVAGYGLEDRLAGIRAVGVPVLELRARRAETLERLVSEARGLIDAGAAALVLGCMTMGFLDVAGDLERQVGVPVVNPALAALWDAEEAAAGARAAGTGNTKRD